MCLHIVALIAIYVLPKFIRGERRATTHLQTSSKSSLGGDHEPGVSSKVDVQNSTTDSLNGKETIKTAISSPQVAAPEEDEQISSQVDQNIKPPQLPIVVLAREAVSVPHDQCEMDQLSSKLMEKIEAETKNIEDFIDKTVTHTVTGIVEFKKDLMRECEIPNSLRKRTSLVTTMSEVVAGATGKPQTDESAAFIKKEIEVINAVVQQANVLPAVLSNGHAK